MCGIGNNSKLEIYLEMSTTSFTKKTLGLETVEPAVTPPPPGSTTFTKKPKMGSSKS